MAQRLRESFLELIETGDTVRAAHVADQLLRAEMSIRTWAFLRQAVERKGTVLVLVQREPDSWDEKYSSRGHRSSGGSAQHVW